MQSYLISTEIDSQTQERGLGLRYRYESHQLIETSEAMGIDGITQA